MSTQAATLSKTPADSGLSAARLVAALAPFDLLIERRTTVPALACVQLWVSNGRLWISGTDLDTQLRVSLPYDGVPFKTLVPLHPLTAALQAFGSACPVFSSTPHKLTLTHLPTSVDVVAYDPDDFQWMVKGRDGAEFDVGRSVLLDRLKTCRPAISSEETRYYLCGISIKPAEEPGFVEMAATDGHRLHITRLNVEVSGTLPQVILRSTAVRLLTNLLGLEAEPSCNARISERFISVDCGDDWLLETKPIDGTYPDYSRMTPAPGQGAGTLRFDADEVVSGLLAIERMGGNGTKPVTIDLGACKLGYRSTDSGVSFSRGFSATVEGEVPPEIGFNAKYLKAMLSLKPKHNAIVTFGENNSAPVRVEFEGDNAFVGVLMPMRV